jgi:peptidoglycan/xylan/chitin deacetylase (PgdA/CDA1 family)
MNLTPILMYHEIGEPGRDAVASWTVSPRRFCEHLDMLRDAGYTGVSVAQWLADRGGRPSGARPVVLTFDDGLAGNARNAIPALMERGWMATFFVISGSMGKPGFSASSDWRDAAGAGMDVASHTVTHPFMATLAEAEARRELADSRAALEDAVGASVRGFSWPNGDAHPHGRRLLSETGYHWAATSRAAFAAPGTDAMDLPRLAVRSAHTAESLARLMDTGAAHRARMLAACQAKRLARTLLGRDRYARVQSRVAGDSEG